MEAKSQSHASCTRIVCMYILVLVNSVQSTHTYTYVYVYIYIYVHTYIKSYKTENGKHRFFFFVNGWENQSRKYNNDIYFFIYLKLFVLIEILKVGMKLGWGRFR